MSLVLSTVETPLSWLVDLVVTIISLFINIDQLDQMMFISSFFSVSNVHSHHVLSIPKLYT